MKRKVIKFGSSHDYAPTPVPSFTKIPDWYKKIPKFSGGASGPRIDSESSDHRFSNKTVKHCAPFLDALTAGYVVELWQDLQVTRTIHGPEFNWPVDPKVVDARPASSSLDFPTPIGCYPTQYVWVSPFIINTPPGYSCLISHPFNRLDLPYITMSAIMDSDVVLPSGGAPFYLKEDFEGIIEAGTPLFQVLPFKRENWRSEVDSSLKESADKSWWFTFRTSKGFYRENHWHKKRYE